MNKDVIYIDVEDDITAIIGKVKDSKQRIVALVPPKRVGVLQSAVNLHLLTRAAKQSDKRLVLITNNSALSALASAAKIPIAKNLQSKPEIAEIPALDVDDGEDIIDGAQLPVGELTRTADVVPLAAALADPAIEDAIRENGAEEKKPRATPPAPGQLPRKPKAKNGIKVPNFNTFRKKLILGAGAGALLLIFLVWAVFFAPRATVLITARTTDASMNDKVNLDTGATTSLQTGAIKASTQQVKKDVSVDFPATGKKDVGEKATGTVKLSRQSMSTTSVPAGTRLTSDTGLVFVTNNDAVIPASTVGGSCFPTACAGSTTTGVTAEERGTDYNGATGSLSGAPNGASANFTDATTGGTDKTITTPTQADVEKAKDTLKDKDIDTVKQELKSQFGSDYVIVEETFKVDMGDVKSSPAVGDEAQSGNAKLTGEVTYTLTGVDKEEMKKYLDAYFAHQLEGKNDQRVYNNGLDTVRFTGVVENKGSSYTANLVANAQVGPKIDDNQIKDLAKGKRYGEIQSGIEAIAGVDNVDIKFWPFWVSSAPQDTNRISVEFKLNESK